MSVSLRFKSAPLEDEGEIPLKSASKGDKGDHRSKKKLIFFIQFSLAELLYYTAVNRIVPYKNLNLFIYLLHIQLYIKL